MQETTRSYELLERLGAGGFGEVYRAREHAASGIPRYVSIKLLYPWFSANRRALDRFVSEARILSRLASTRIPRFEGLIRINDRDAIVTEYIDGADLTQALRTGLPRAALLDVIAEIADVLDWAWTARDPEKGQPLRLVHRDIKPANIRLRREGGVCLLDFGLAVSDTVTVDPADRRGRAGTPVYMAPERFRNGGQPAPAGDTFSLGCVFYEGLSGERYFATGTQASALALQPDALRTHHTRQMARLPGDLPPDIPALLGKMLSGPPDQRPTASAVAAQCAALAAADGGLRLRAFLRQAQPPAPPPPEAVASPAANETLQPLEESPSQPTGRRRLLILGVSAPLWALAGVVWLRVAAAFFPWSWAADGWVVTLTEPTIATTRATFPALVALDTAPIDPAHLIALVVIMGAHLVLVLAIRLGT